MAVTATPKNSPKPADQPRTFHDLFPNIRWVFPSAPTLQSERFGTDMSQWFDMWSVENPTERPELQHPGLHQSIEQILGVIKKEEMLVPRERILLVSAKAALRTEDHQGFGNTTSVQIHTGNTQDLRPALMESGRYTPIFLSHSADDDVVPIDNGRELRDILRSRRLQVKWREYEDGGHWVNEPQGMDDITSFMKGHMTSDCSVSAEL
ncbi:lysophospholipase II [Xylaria intraflava]|nr:lysophospholipase II [Xylaria intraflava]